MNRKTVQNLAAGLSLLTMMSAGPAWAKTIEEEVSVTPVKTVTADEQDIISSAAVKVLRHIAQARADIHDKDMTRAKAELQQSLTLINIIKASLPTVKVKDHIWVAKKHLSYENTEEVMPDLIPITVSLDEIEDIVPVEKARQHVSKAKEHLQKGNKKGAADELELADESLVYTEIDLPLAYTEKHLISAQGFLAKNETDKADKALKDAEDGVQFISVDVYSPMQQAKKSLWQSAEDYTAGKYEAAKAEFKAAQNYLKEAASQTDKTIRKESEKLLHDAEAVGKKMNKGSKEAGQDLKSLYERAKKLAQNGAHRFQSGDKN